MIRRPRVIRKQLGVTRIVDLRSSAELDEDGIGLVSDRLEHQHVPIFEQNSSLWDGREVRLIALYRHMIKDGAPQLMTALRIVARAGSPTVFHCTAGKDRTGVLAGARSARAETMQELLAIVRREHGGTSAWAERHRFATSEIDHLRTTLVA